MTDLQAYIDSQPREQQIHVRYGALQNRVEAAIKFCQRHEHPGVVTAVHEFAKRVREILEDVK